MSTPPPLPDARAIRLAVVAAVNRREVLAENLAASPMIAQAGVPLMVEEGHATAGLAYNAGLARCDADVVIFAHQDVYFPAGWEANLRDALRVLEHIEPAWAVLGVTGRDLAGLPVGRVWSTGLCMEVGEPVTQPTLTGSVDEMVIVLRVNAGLRFDEQLPGYHLYGTDIVLQAMQAGLGAYVIHAPAVHNSNKVRRLDRQYGRAYRYMVGKWRDRLPWTTCVAKLTRCGLPLWKLRWRMWRGKMRNHDEVPARRSGAAWARELKWE